MDIKKLLENIESDATRSENKIGGVAASFATKKLVKFWNCRDVCMKDIQSDLDHTISDLINLKLRLQVVADEHYEELLEYESVMEKASDIVDEIN